MGMKDGFPYPSYIYVLNGGSTTLSAIRWADDTVAATIDVGGPPISIASAPRVAKLYVGVFNRGAVIIRTSDHTIQKSIKTNPGVWDCPQTIALTPDGSKIYVIDTQPVDIRLGTMSVINIAEDAVGATFPVALLPYFNSEDSGVPAGSGAPPTVSFSRDGSKAYITAPALPYLSVFQTSDYSQMNSIPIGEEAHKPLISPDGSKLFVHSLRAEKGDAVLSVIDTEKDIILNTIPLPNSPVSMEMAPDGSVLYLTSAGAKKGDPSVLSVVNTATDGITGTIVLPDLPSSMLVSPDGSKIYLTNPAKGSISVIQTADPSLLDPIQVGENPSGLMLSPDGTKLYVANRKSGSVSVIHTSDHALLATVEVGPSPQFFA